MAIEIERKFLLIPDKLPVRKQGTYIQQGYLMLQGKQQLRVRIVDNKKAFICYKVCISSTNRQEYEYEVPIEDGRELLSSCKIKLAKKRVSFMWLGYHVDVDYYPYDGVAAIAEIEIRQGRILHRIPPFCGKEVTGMKKYSNINIAKCLSK